MATCDIQALSRDASCFYCVPPGFFYPIKLALLARWLKSLNPTADTSVQGLMNQGQCFSCLPPGQWYPLRLAVLCRIMSGQGGGGGTPCTVPDPLGPLGIFSSNQGTVCFTVGIPIPPPASIIISYGTTNGGPYPTSVTFPVPGPICISGLASSVTYYFVAQGSNGPNCTTAVTNQVSYTPPAPPSPDVPVDFTIDLGSASDDVLLTWTDPETPDHFQIWVNINNAGYNLLTTVAGNVLSYHDHTGMAVDDLWCYKIRAETGGVFSSFSAEVCIADGIDDHASVTIDYPNLILSVASINLDSNFNLTSISMPRLAKVVGDADFHGCQVATIDCSLLSTVTGNIKGYNNPLTTPTFPALTTVGGNIDFDACPSMTSIGFPVLTTVGGFIDISSNTSITSVNFNSLISVVGQVTFGSDTALTSLSFPVLTTLGNNLGVNACTSLVSLSAPSLLSIGGDLDVGSCTTLGTLTITSLQSVAGVLNIGGTAITALSANNLTTLGSLNVTGLNTILVSVSLAALPSIDDFVVSGFTSLTTLTFTNLVTVTNSQVLTASFDISGCTGLTSLSLPAFVSIDGNFDATGATALASLSFKSGATFNSDLLFGACSSLISVTVSGAHFNGNLNGQNCGNLTTLTLGSAIFSDSGELVDFNPAKLNQSSVDAILHRCVVSGVTTLSIDLAGGTNSPPTLACINPLSDCFALQAAGNTVNTN